MTVSATPSAPRQRQAVLGQLPRITRADGSAIKVLLVDDEPALTNLLKMALHYEGWEIEVMDIDGPRVDRLLIRPPRGEGDGPVFVGPTHTV